MTLHVIPIEPIKKRYSAQWLTWFNEELQKYSKYNHILQAYEPFRYLEDGTTTTIKCGEFLDVTRTHIYKSQQIQILMEMFELNRIKNGDTILLLDGWFPGVEAIAYARDALGLKIKIVGMFHAGTYDPHDFLTQRGMDKWGKYVETGWFKIYDKIIVATQYHKQLLVKTREVDPAKIHVIFFPMYTDWVKEMSVHDKKEDMIVFPHRIAPEKNYQKFDMLMEYHYPVELNFVTTATNYITKEGYWEALSKAKIAVSFSDQETWGIAMIESVLSGAIPIVPDRLSYSELYPSIFKYKGSYNAPIEVEEVHKFICLYYNDKDFRQRAETEVAILRDKFITLGMTSIPTIINQCCALQYNVEC